MDSKGYYSLLNLPPNATAKQIKEAYRRQVKIYHPDINKDPTAHHIYLQINEAYQVLLNPDKRRAYDNVAEPALGFKPCCSCTRHSVQPRVVFFTNDKSVIGGVYCHACAIKAQFRASLKLWKLFFKKPIYVLKALKSNYRMDQKPPDKNWAMLMDNAMAFKRQNRNELARSLAEQALKFATSESQTLKSETFIALLPAVSRRKDFNSWEKTGLDFIRVYFPALIFAFVAVISLTTPILKSVLSPAPQKITDYQAVQITPMPLAQNLNSLMYYTTAPQTPGYQAPCIDCGIIVLLPEKTQVRLTGVIKDTPWVQIKTPRGLIVYVKKSYLTQGLLN